MSRVPGASSRRSRLAAIPYGGLAHHRDGPAGQPQARRVGVHHGDVAEPVTEPGGPPGMQLDGDYLRPSPDQRRGERALARSEVEDKLARPDAGLRDDPRGPLIGEPVPTPQNPQALRGPRRRARRTITM